MADKNKKVAGVDVLLKVKNKEGKTIILGGQTNANLNREAQTMDVTDKTTGGFSTSMAGLISWSIDVEGFVVLGNESMEVIEDSFLNRQTVDAEIRVGADDEVDGLTYTGSGYIVDLPLDFAQDSAVTYSFTIEGASPLVRTKGVVVAG